MRRLLVATRSRGKQAEFRSLLIPLGYELVFPQDLGLAESAAEQALEVFDTFEQNAAAKAHWFAERTGLWTLADDSGLEVDALGGAPGVRSKRFAGRDGPDEEVSAANNAALLARLASVAGPVARSARYRCVLVLSRGLADGLDDVVVHGTTEGRILEEPRGAGGFGYDPLFWSNDLGCTFGEATRAAKDTVSHRGRAVAALVKAWRGE